jgi:PIN domain nuclease of toxin-antitoxin system
MSKAVLDASAILAVIFREPGAEKLTSEILETAIASTVNLAEVQTKLIQKGYDPEEAWEDANLLKEPPAPYTSDQAKTAGTLVKKTQSYGLSLGDRSCLALAIALNAPVYTTEQVWKNLKVGVPIHVIR